MERVEALCSHMQDYPPELYLAGDHLLFDYDAGHFFYFATTQGDGL